MQLHCELQAAAGPAATLRIRSELGRCQATTSSGRLGARWSALRLSWAISKAILFTCSHVSVNFRRTGLAGVAVGRTPHIYQFTCISTADGTLKSDANANAIIMVTNLHGQASASLWCLRLGIVLTEVRSAKPKAEAVADDALSAEAYTIYIFI